MVAHGIDPGTPVPGVCALIRSATSSTEMVDLLESILRLPWDRGTVSDVASATYWKMSHYFWFFSKDVAILGHIPTPVHQSLSCIATTRNAMHLWHETAYVAQVNPSARVGSEIR